MSTALEEIVFQDEALVPIWDKVRKQERLGFEDGLAVLRSWDLTAIGKMADFVKQKKSGDDVFFVMNRQINPTNLCVLDCVFCDFAARPGDAHAYEMSVEEILGKLTGELSEVHIVGGLHPKWKFEHYLGILQAIHETYPTIQIKAWTAVEIDWFARIGKMDVREVFHRLREAGLQSLPGGGAEVFSERVREATFKHKMGAD
ncbi:MAG: radical SAM protein, partial [Vicinamibacteria bacterium]